ncbi:hypothetical protein VC83_03452 [Pseudogymnoascus destructans]|uniref:DAGKc domain-containing protein n=2 Tax=Pseudogymnoascus destructans TaxID=655981 RepID=L8FQ64_PSED2|nr:uncharacterized protein VC83_03452 [Pseudogymnoascus destructans]ELR03095.1 hypothetical protein GMDG_05934 [Pseudogymnoascus destructans 20631-21]OAF60392.1 hypothetical protein VC83_03452 [Pseudogymnoascus destructans]
MTTSEATVNAEPAEFTYGNNALTWAKAPGTVSSVEDKGTILESDVLAIIATSTTPPAHTVYTIPAVSSPENTALPVPDVQLHQTTLLGAPPSFITPHLLSSPTPHLSLPAEDIHVVISSKSGTAKAAAFFESVLAPALKVLGLGENEYQVVHTTSHETITELAEGTLREKAAKGVRQTVILLSGDGGVVELLNGLVGAEVSSTYTRPAIALFPFGTGNALFHSTHRLPTPPLSPLHHALTTLLLPTSRPLPHFRASFSSASLLTNEGRTATPLPNNELHGCIVASYGFHSTLVADSDTAELREFGDKRFGIVAQELLGAPHRYKAGLTITSRGKERVVERERHAYILCTLVSNLEKTFTISPATTPLDEVMRVVHFDSGSGEEIMGVMAGAYSGGKHVNRNDGLVGYEEVEVLKIDFKEASVEGNEGKWLRVCVDGLIVRVDSGGWMKVEKVGKGGEVLDIVV